MQVEMELFPGVGEGGGEGWEEEIRSTSVQLLASDDMQLDVNHRPITPSQPAKCGRT